MSDELDFSISESVSSDKILSSSAKGNRLSWVSTQIGGPDGFFFFQDGRFSRYIFQEALHCYIEGQFICTIVLAFSFIERSLAGRFFEIGRADLERSRSEDLLIEAQKIGWLSIEEHTLLQDLKSIRNSVAHFRDPSDFSRPEIRALLSAKEPYVMLENEAKQVLLAAFRVLNKTAI
jgi:hypothetical protein